MKNKIFHLMIITFSICCFVCCKKENDFDVFNNTYKKPPENILPDEEGNLYINNLTKDVLQLYIGNTFCKKIPPFTNKFLVKIDNTIVSANDTLKIWKEEDVANIYELDQNTVYRTWQVEIPINFEEKNRITWMIGEFGSISNSTLTFNYLTTGLNNIPTIYAFDLHINSKNLPETMSFKPGDNKKLGLTYGQYVFYLHYWFPNPSMPNEKIFLGWSDEIEAIDVTLNSTYANRTIDIPLYYYSSVGRKGQVTIKNNTQLKVSIFANSMPISNFISGNNYQYSGQTILGPGEIFSHIIQEEQYEIKIIDINNNEQLLPVFDLHVIELYGTEFEIILDIEQYKTINIANQTNKRFTIHNGHNEDYLGFWVEPNSSAQFKFDKRITSLKAICWLNTESHLLYKTPNDSTAWIIN